MSRNQMAEEVMLWALKIIVAMVALNMILDCRLRAADITATVPPRGRVSCAAQ